MSVDCFDNFVWEEKTADEKVDAELADLAFDSTVTSDKVIDLLGVGKYYDDVTITWTTDNENAVVADGKLTLTVPNGTIVVKVTATATCGDVTKERVFEIKLSKEATPVADIIEIGAAMEHNTYTEGKYITAGIITEVYNTQYGNMKITDANGNILTVYGTYGADGVDRYDALESKPVAGDYVVLLGVVGQYNDTPQMKNAWILSFTSPTSIKDALGICEGSEHNKFDGEKYVVTGVITEVYNTQYGNMRIKDEEGNILTIYGSYDANGKNRYDAMETKPVAGDTVTVYGALGRYNETYQMKNGWIIGHTLAPTGEEHVCADENGDYICDDEECGKVVAPAADSTLTVEQILALGAVHAHNTYTTGKYYVTGVITEVYNTQYGNMYITDANGNILTIYGTYSADGSAGYGAMETKPVAGDTVTIYGIIGQYNGTVQVKNGWITDHTASDAPHVNKLVVGETNKIVVDGTTLNGFGLPVAWVEFVVTEKAVYTFVANNSALALIYDAADNAANNLCGFTGSATLEAGTYYICVGSGVVGEFNVTVTKAAIEAPEHTCADANGDFLCDSEDCGKILAPVADSTLTVEQVLALGKAHAHNTYTEGKYSVTGVITEVYNTQYGNMKIKDENGNILTIYGTYSADGSTRYDAMETKPVAGDTVTVYGIVGQYNGTAQVKNGWITAHTAPHQCESVCDTCGKCLDTECTEEVCANNRCPGHEEVHTCADANGDFLCDSEDCGKILAPVADSTLTVEQVLALGKAHAHNTYTEGKYSVTGVITEVYNTQYGNMKIKDENGNILTIYGTYSADGSTRYDAMETKPVAGDTVTVYGIVGQYNGTAQVKNGWITAHTHEHSYENVVSTKPTCTTTGLATPTCACGATDEEVTLPMAHTLDENNLCSVCNKYVLDASLLVAFEKNEDEPKYPAGTPYNVGFFSILFNNKGSINSDTKTFSDGWAGTQRINFSSKTTIDGDNTVNVIKFTVTEATTVTVWWRHAGKGETDPTKSDAYRNVAIFDAEGNIVAQTEGEHNKDALIISTFEIDAAGTYYLGNLINHNYIFKIEVDAPAKEEAPATQYSYTFEKQQFTANGTLALGDLEWTLAGNGGYWGYDSQYGKGQQFGSGGKPYKTMTLTSGEVTGVTKIVINTSGASDIKGTLTVTVGGVQIGNTITLTKTATGYTLTSDTALSGAVVLTYTQTSSKALYIKSIAINPAE